MEYDISSLDQLSVAAKTISANKPSVIALFGDLGSGKTTFVKLAMKHLAMNDEVSSPSYSIVNVYNDGPLIVHHLDLYRLNSTREALDLGWEEILDHCDIAFIEWPEIVEEILDDDIVKLYFSMEDDKRLLKKVDTRAPNQ